MGRNGSDVIGRESEETHVDHVIACQRGLVLTHP